MRIPGSTDEAVAEFREALRIRPHYPEVHYKPGTVLSDMPWKRSEAAAHLREALRARPDFAPAQQMLAQPGV